MRISDWSSDVCSSDLGPRGEIFQQAPRRAAGGILLRHLAKTLPESLAAAPLRQREKLVLVEPDQRALQHAGKAEIVFRQQQHAAERHEVHHRQLLGEVHAVDASSEEHTSELQSLMRNSSAVFCLKQKTPHMKTAP